MNSDETKWSSLNLNLKEGIGLNGCGCGYRILSALNLHAEP